MNASGSTMPGSGRKRQAAIRTKLAPPGDDFVPIPRSTLDGSIGSRFEEMARLRGDATAVVDGERTISYRQLDARADMIAAAISRTGATTVALLLDNGIPMIEGMLGALKAGAIFVPLDPLFPDDRLRRMVEHSETSVILTSSHHTASAASLGEGLVTIAIDRVEQDDAEWRASPVGPEDLAYIVYTSGSTGLPKGIAHNHRNVLHCIAGYTEAFRIGRSDRLSLLHSASFSSGIVDIFLALLNGASLHAWNLKERGFGGLADWFDAQRITVLDWVPTPFRHFMAVLDPRQTLSSVRLLVLASEAVTERDFDSYKAHFPPGCVMVNRLGTTEAYNFRLFFLDRDTDVRGVVPAGYEVPDKEVVLFREDGTEVDGPDEVGEIGVTSRYLAVGYWNRPDLTADAFRHRGSSLRTYMTGDIGRMAPDGCLDYLGRRDDQVKIRGYRIEMAEIEMALMKTGAFANVAVAAPETRSGERRLVAYLVPRDGNAPSPSRLRQRLAASLPDYMLPAAYVQVNELPTTPTGKIARADLPIPVQPQEGDDPQTDTERELARMWCDLLDLDRVGRDDRLLDLGGHSLLVARLFERIERRFGVRLPLSTMFDAPTLAELAAVVERGEEGRSWSPLVPIQPEGNRPPLFFVHAHLGNVVGFYDLARHLGPDQPFYGLQAVGLDNGEAAVDDLAEMAASYVAALRGVQPEGPYFLGGYCFGGAVAYEMASQLRSQGKEVGLLVMVEGTSNRYPIYRRRWWGRRLADKVGDRAVREVSMLRERQGSFWGHIGERASRARDLALAGAERAAANWRHQSSFSSAYHSRVLAEAHSRAYRSHDFGTFDGHVLLVRARRQPSGAIPDPTLGWGEAVTGHLDMCDVPGQWIGMLSEPRVAITAEHIRTALDQSLAGADTA